MSLGKGEKCFFLSGEVLSYFSVSLLEKGHRTCSPALLEDFVFFFELWVVSSLRVSSPSGCYFTFSALVSCARLKHSCKKKVQSPRLLSSLFWVVLRSLLWCGAALSPLPCWVVVLLLPRAAFSVSLCGGCCLAPSSFGRSCDGELLGQCVGCVPAPPPLGFPFEPVSRYVNQICFD